MTNRSFPHPVLDPGASDYPNCGIQFLATMFTSSTSYRFDVDVDLGSDTLISEIDAGNAMFAVQVDCGRTLYRRVYKFGQREFKIDIPESKLRGNVLLRPFVVAERAFTLRSNEFNSLFEGMSFPLRKGYVLAWDNPLEFDADKTLDDLKNINSILQIVRYRKADVPIEYNLSGDKIEIHLPEKDFEAYSLFKTNAAYRNSFMCMFALPAVAYALQSYFEDKGSLQSRWARVIERRLTALRTAGVSDDDPWKLAQLILDLPVSRAVQAIASYEEQSE